MSRKHPENGPSLSKASNGNKKPPTEKELADRRAREKRSERATMARVDEAQRKVASGKRFGAAVKANGGTIPLRGGNTTSFGASPLRKPDGRNQIKSTSTYKIHTRPGPKSQ